MKRIFTVLILVVSLSAFAQEKGELTGMIMDGALIEEPLVFAKLSLKGTAIHAETDLHGVFYMNQLSPGTYTLVINFVGYDTKEITVSIEESKTTNIHEVLESKSLNRATFSEARNTGKVIEVTEPSGQ